MMHQNGLTKLIEECGELAQIAAKKSAYMDTDTHPDGAGSLKKRLEDELADVCAAGAFVIQTFGLDSERMKRRTALKLDTFQKWHREQQVPERSTKQGEA